MCSTQEILWSPIPNKHPDWTFLALLEELLKILTQFWHRSSLMNFFNEGDWFHSFSSHTCNTWKHLFSADWNEGPTSVPIIYRFYKTASNEILFKRDNKQYHRKELISSFQMNGYANFHFIAGGEVFAWSPSLPNFAETLMVFSLQSVAPCCETSFSLLSSWSF